PWRAYWSAHLLGAPGPPEVSFPTQSPQGPSRPSIQSGVIRPPSTGYGLRTVSKIPPVYQFLGRQSQCQCYQRTNCYQALKGPLHLDTPCSGKSLFYHRCEWVACGCGME
ncbi:hypothetical protein FD755_000558, partial [Muntiacus reevesi]